MSIATIGGRVLAVAYLIPMIAGWAGGDPETRGWCIGSAIAVPVGIA
jgi:hypothetical protein